MSNHMPIEQYIQEQIALRVNLIAALETEFAKLSSERIGHEQYCVCRPCIRGDLIASLITRLNNELVEWRKPLC